MDNGNDTTWVRGMLHPGENLLWTGKPGKGHFLRKEDAFVIPFGIMWCGYAIFWEISAFKDNSPFIFKLCGIPLAMAGLYILVGRFFVRRYREKRSRYALTSERIAAKVGNQIQTLELCNLPHISVNHRADGTGDIRFGDTWFNYLITSGLSFSSARSYSATSVLELLNISDVNQVENRIRTAVEQALAARRSVD